MTVTHIFVIFFDIYDINLTNYLKIVLHFNKDGLQIKDITNMRFVCKTLACLIICVEFPCDQININTVTIISISIFKIDKIYRNTTTSIGENYVGCSILKLRYVI